MSKNTPKTPSPKETSAAQTGTNVATAVANTYAQNGNITTDDGTRTTTFREQDIYDPYTNSTYKGVIPDVVETLSPAQQAIKDQQNQTNLGLSTLANKQTAKISEYMDTPFSYDSGTHTKWATDLYGNINGDDFAREQEQARSKLSNMGIKLGSDAYNNEMSRLERSQAKQRDQFLLDSEGQGFSQAQATRNQPFNEITALMSGSQVSQPNFTGASAATIPTTDNAAIINQDYANRVAAANSSNASTASALSGLGSLFSLSDKRTKKNIKPMGKANGQKIVKFEYKKGFGRPGIKVGMLAQDVEKKTPEAVVTGRDGLKRVNYAKAIALGARRAA